MAMETDSREMCAEADAWWVQVGNICAITAGHNIGRIGTIQHTEKHPGGHNIVHVKDKTGATWATRQVQHCLWIFRVFLGRTSDVECCAFAFAG